MHLIHSEGSLKKQIQHRTAKFMSKILFLAAGFFDRQKMQRIYALPVGHIESNTILSVFSGDVGNKTMMETRHYPTLLTVYPFLVKTLWNIELFPPRKYSGKLFRKGVLSKCCNSDKGVLYLPLVLKEKK